MSLRVSTTSRDRLLNLPTPARPTVDARDVVVPDGYEVEPLVAGLSFPTDIVCADDGTVFIAEGGSTWPALPAMLPRILSLSPDGILDEYVTDVLGGPRGLAIWGDALYVSVKGGSESRIDRIDLRTRASSVVVDNLPNGGAHEPGGPVFGPDGLMYFGHGSVSLQGVVLPAGNTVDLAKYPLAQDFPGQDVTLSGNVVWSRDPRVPFPNLVATSAFKPFGVAGEKGEVIPGKLKCTTGVWRSRPDGSDLELLAWGIRNPYGIAIDETGDLYVSDNDLEERGERPVGDDPDRIWRLPNARRPLGSLTGPDWYGFPDYCGDGLPVWDPKHHPNRGPVAEPQLENPPLLAGPAAVLFEPHTSLAKMDFCRSDTFRHRGDLFLCQWGTLAPLNTLRPNAADNGFQVARVNVYTGQVEPFFNNRLPGPASHHPGSGGIERPVACRFSPDGRSLYVLDFGIVRVTTGQMTSYAHTGVLWRITRR